MGYNLPHVQVHNLPKLYKYWRINKRGYKETLNSFCKPGTLKGWHLEEE